MKLNFVDFQYDVTVSTDIRRKVKDMMDNMEATKDAKAHGRKVSVPDEQYYEALDMFDDTISLMAGRMANADMEIMMAIEGLTVTQIRQHDLWGVLMDGTAERHEEALRKMAKKAEAEDGQVIWDICKAFGKYEQARRNLCDLQDMEKQYENVVRAR